jgi:hypothetical protein
VGEDVMHLDKPELSRYLTDPKLVGYAVLQKLFFTPSHASQAAGAAFIARLARREHDLDPRRERKSLRHKLQRFREWDRLSANLKSDAGRLALAKPRDRERTACENVFVSELLELLAAPSSRRAPTRRSTPRVCDHHDGKPEKPRRTAARCVAAPRVVNEGHATPLEALQIATLGSARVLGLDGVIGTVELGKLANLVLLGANPLEAIDNTQQIERVIKDGHVFDAQQLR